MGISPYMKALRERVGDRLLLVPCVAAVIHDQEGRVLLQHGTQGFWSLPAWAIDPGESPAQAVVREVWEETGLLVRPSRVLGVFGGIDGFRLTYPGGDKVEFHCIVFACTAIGGELGGRDDETVELRYFEPAAMPQMPISYPPDIYRVDYSGGTFAWG